MVEEDNGKPPMLWMPDVKVTRVREKAFRNQGMNLA